MSTKSPPQKEEEPETGKNYPSPEHLPKLRLDTTDLLPLKGYKVGELRKF